MFALFGFGFTMLLMGPSAMFKFPDYVGIVIASFPFSGFFQVFLFIPIIPEIVERVQVKLEITAGEDDYVDSMLNDKCNDAYGFIYALSMGVSPIIGSYIEGSNGARATCDQVALLNFALGILFFVFNCGFGVFFENKQFQARLAELNSKLQKQLSESKSHRSAMSAMTYKTSKSGKSFMGGNRMVSASHHIGPQKAHLAIVDTYKQKRRDFIRQLKSDAAFSSQPGTIYYKISHMGSIKSKYVKMKSGENKESLINSLPIVITEENTDVKIHKDPQEI